MNIDIFNAHLVLPGYPEHVRKLADSMVLMLQLGKQLDRSGWDGTAYRNKVVEKQSTLDKISGGTLVVQESGVL